MDIDQAIEYMTWRMSAADDREALTAMVAEIERLRQVCRNYYMILDKVRTDAYEIATTVDTFKDSGALPIV